MPTSDFMKTLLPLSTSQCSKIEIRKGLFRWFFIEKHVKKTKDGGRRTWAETRATTVQVNVTLKRLSVSVLHVLCTILLIMCMDVETNPGPDDQYNSFVQVMDWRCEQILHCLQLHTATINRVLSDKFNKLDSTLGQLVSDVNGLKEFARQGTDDIKNLQEDCSCILQRLDTLEQTVETTEAETKLCNLKFFGLCEPSERYGTTSEDQILGILTDHSTRVWNYSDVKRAFRIGERRQPDEEPRPLIVQFQRWSDKMEILTDRELRDSLRREGIKVTSELTTKQRNVVEFHKQRGKIAFYRNGRLQIINKDPNKYQYRARYQRKNYYQDSDDGYDEEWPRPSHTQRHDEHGNKERGPNGNQRGDTDHNSQRRRREVMRYDTDHQSRRKHTDRHWDRYRGDDRQHTRSRRQEDHQQYGNNTLHTTWPDKSRDVERWVYRGERDKDSQRHQPYEDESLLFSSRGRYDSPNPQHRINDVNSRNRPVNNTGNKRNDQPRDDGRRVVPGHRTYSEAVMSVPRPDSRLTTRSAERCDNQQINVQRWQYVDSAQSTETHHSESLLQAPIEPAASVPNNDIDHDTDTDIGNTEETVGRTADRHTQNRQTEDRGDKTFAHNTERADRLTDDRNTEDRQMEEHTDITTQLHDDSDRVQSDPEHNTNSGSATHESNTEEVMPEVRGPIPEVSSCDRRPTATSRHAEQNKENSDKKSGNPLHTRSRATDRSNGGGQARSVSRPTRALRSDNKQKRALSQTNITDAFRKRQVKEPANTKVSEDHRKTFAATAPQDKDR